MARIQLLKTLVNQRLTAAAEEIFGVFERTITQYEEEIHRQREMLDLVLNPEIKLPRADPPQLLVCEEEVPPEQQERSPSLGQEERSPSLGQEEPEPLQIKEEEEELWSSEEGEQLQGLEEADIIDLTSTPVPVKSEHDEEKPQSSWFNQNQTEENREAEPLASTSTEQMKTEPGGEDCGISEPASNLDPAGDLEPSRFGQLLSSDYSRPETEDSYEWEETGEPQSGSNTLKSKMTQRVKGQSLSTSNMFNTSTESSHELKSNQIPPAHCCKVCTAPFAHKRNLMAHVYVHVSDCGLCGKHLESKESLKLHLKTNIKDLACPMRATTEVFVCSVCGKRFGYKGNLKVHMRTHTGEKPFNCIFCEKRFGRKGELKVHMRTHTGEKPYSCAVCGKRYGHKGNLQIHLRTHTGEKPFSCTVCSKEFSLKAHAQKHMEIHAGEQWHGQKSECRWAQRKAGGPSPSNTSHTMGWGGWGTQGQQ